MKLSILIATLASRKKYWTVLLESLNEQAFKYRGVEILTSEDDGEESPARKRQRLLHQAAGQYIAFVDETHVVSPKYVDTIVEALRESPRFVTFPLSRVRMWHGCERSRSTEPVHKCGQYWVWRSDIAKMAAIPHDIGKLSDQCWWRPLVVAGGFDGAIRLQSSLCTGFSDREFMTNACRVKELPFRDDRVRVFRKEDDLFVEHSLTSIQCPDGMVAVRDRFNRIFRCPQKMLTECGSFRVKEV